MRPLLCLSILFASCAWADEGADRTAIEKVISTLNASPTERNLFTADFDGFRVLLARVEIQPGGMPSEERPVTVVISREPWGEATWSVANTVPLRLRSPFEIRAIRFVTPDVALLDTSTARSSSVLFVLKREGTDWRIASLRVIAQP